jgi:hypothetical protein
MTRTSEAAIERDRKSSRERYYGRREYIRKQQNERKRSAFDTRPFVGWDSEGYDAFVVNSAGECWKLPQRTMLFMCSEGDYVSGINVSTQEMLDLVLEVEARNPDVYHVGFSFEYDVNQMLQDLPWRMLAVLKFTGKVRWKGYRISHVPHKLIRITKNGVSATIYDCFGYFHTKYENALQKYGIGNDKQLREIASGKSKRGHFTYADLPEVTQYCATELALLPPLMECIREASYTGGYRISAWHGPGALASFALHANGANHLHSRRTHDVPSYAIRAAYAGGRFQAWQCGEYYGDVYTLDKNSAYVQAIAMLPRLDNGKWSRHNPRDIKGPDNIARFGLYHIVFNDRDTRAAKLRKQGYPARPYPLFHRDSQGRLTWPDRVDGWYWSPEARLVAGDSRAEFTEAIVYGDDSTYPFRWVEDSYRVRLRYQDPEHYSPAEKAYKWALAAIYGAFARRVGWDRKTKRPPRSHELAWAGYITSHCRAAIYDVAAYAYSKGALISVDTDGVTATCSFPESIVPEGFGNQLGQWKQDHYTGVVYWQNGIYWLRQDGKWVEAKSRGVPKGRIPVEAATDALHNTSFTPGDMLARIETTRTRYVGYRQALNGQHAHWRLWETSPNILTMGGGSGKGLHFPGYCRKCRHGDAGWDMHVISHILPPKFDPVSTPHKLPWLEDLPEDALANMDVRNFQLSDWDIVQDGDVEENL